MVSYNAFRTTDCNAYNVYNAIKYCCDHNEDILVFDKGRYDFYPDMASEDVLCVSNHDIYGIKRIAFLLKNMQNFTIDGGGSEFVFHGSITPFVVKNSENITFKNFSIDYDETMTLDVEVINTGEKFFDVRVMNGDKYYIERNMLHYYNDYEDDDTFHYMSIRSFGNDKSFIPEAKDEFKVSNRDVSFEELNDKEFRVYNSKLQVSVGMRLITRGKERFACNMVIADSANIDVENITMYKSYAMGILVQKTENVSIDRMTVKAKNDSLFSLNADATHFVHCKGLVKVTNCEFSEQQDDALNIHGIYTRIVDKTDDYIIVKYMHKSAKGLNIYEKGDKIAVLNSNTLIPKCQYKILKVEVINMNYTKLYIDGETTNLEIGDSVEDLTWSSDLIFEKNKVMNNRARGILVAARRKVVIRNNYFNTPGVAILFESDGKKWFESGAVTDVEITDNTFEKCKYTRKESWGSYVIEVKPRDEFNDGEYYHKHISITGNRFIDCNSSLLYVDNVEELVFKDNTIENCSADILVETKNCGKVIDSVK